jgi:hypothetical protein
MHAGLDGCTSSRKSRVSCPLPRCNVDAVGGSRNLNVRNGTSESDPFIVMPDPPLVFAASVEVVPARRAGQPGAGSFARSQLPSVCASDTVLDRRGLTRVGSTGRRTQATRTSQHVSLSI